MVLITKAIYHVIVMCHPHHVGCNDSIVVQLSLMPCVMRLVTAFRQLEMLSTPTLGPFLQICATTDQSSQCSQRTPCQNHLLLLLRL